MNSFVDDERFNFIARSDKDFILAFDSQMGRLGYGYGDQIGSGYCWGRYMLIYTRQGVKSKQVYARIYIREECIVLRLFLNDIDRHRKFLENAPGFIKDVFTGPHGACQHCHNEKEGKCKYRKTYTLDNRLIEKCNGLTFEFHDPDLEKLPDYLNLFTEFYPARSR